MMRAAILTFCLFTVLSVGAQTFSENFNEGIPASFKVYDEDGFTLNQSMTGLGFKKGNSWISYTLKDDQGAFAASTSKYENPGTSDDWLVTPKIKITEGLWLEWKAISCSKTSKAGYKVLVSTSGSEVRDFKDLPVFEIEEEESSWTLQYVSLDSYKGKDIYIAFVNNSNDKYILGIDDIEVKKPAYISALSSTTPASIGEVPDFGISGKIRANYSQVINSFTASYTCGDLIETQEFSGLNIQPGEEYEFRFDKKLVSLVGDTAKYSISVNVEGEKYTTKGTTVCYAFTPKRSFVLEEATGTWCGWCTAGHVALDYMRETYPDDLITIAVHNDDPMTVKIYDSGIYSLGVDGYPIGFINRKYKSPPMGADLTPGKGGWETTYLNASEELAPAELDLSVEYTNSDRNEVNFHATAKFALNLPDAKYNIAYLVKECNVRGTTAKYIQNNSYSGSDKEIGGFEKLPVKVPASVMVYHDVARAIKPSFKGDIFVNKAVNEGDEVTADYTMLLPETILNKDNIGFVVLLLNSITGEIVNAKSFQFNSHEHEGLATNMDVLSVESIPEIAFCKTGDGLQVTVKLPNASDLSAGLFDLNGICLSEKEISAFEREHTFTLPVGTQNGVYMLKVVIDGKVFVRKIVF